MPDTRSLLHQAELDAEKISAAVRLVIFATLAVAVLAAGGPAGSSGLAALLVGLYGVGTLVSLLLSDLLQRVIDPRVELR